MTVKMINPEGPRNQSKYFSQSVAVEEPGSTTVYVSGQVAFDLAGELVGEGDLAAQADCAFGNLVSALEAAGAKPGDVVKTNVYIVSLDPEKSGAVGRAMKKHFTQDPMPASTWVGVTSLIDPRLMIEVEATAVVEK